jgi:hypothetical protein
MPFIFLFYLLVFNGKIKNEGFDMTENENLLLKEINFNLSLNEISHKLKVGNNDVWKKIIELENSGFLISKDVYDDGEMRLKFSLEKEKSNTIDILLCDDEKFRALVIADLHVGNVMENLSYLEKAYNYARDNDIHIILNCGDVIDGSFSRGKQNIVDPFEQVSRLTKYYPFDKHILNLICLGNHDYSMYNYNADIRKFLINERCDLIPVGYGMSLMNIGKDQFVIKHPIGYNKWGPIQNKLVLVGHHHKMGFQVNSDNVLIFIPTLSDLHFGGDENPGMIDMQLSLEDGYIHSGQFTHYIVKNDLIRVSENLFEFSLPHTIIDEKEIMPKKLQKKM